MPTVARQPVDLVTLDLRMPGMSGLELQQQLNLRGATLPVIFITGHGDVPMAVEAMQHGAFDFLQKPFRDQDLLDEASKPKPPEEKPLRFSLNNIRIEGGSVDFDDRPKGKKHTVRDIANNFGDVVMPPTDPRYVDGAPGSHELYLMCDDLETTVAELGAKGVEFTAPVVFVDRGSAEAESPSNRT